MELNGYKVHADAYRKYLNDNEVDEETREGMKAHIKALDILSEADEATKNALFASGAFNNTCKGYMSAALDSIDLDHDTKSAAMAALASRFDMMTASEAAQYYMTH